MKANYLAFLICLGKGETKEVHVLGEKNYFS